MSTYMVKRIMLLVVVVCLCAVAVTYLLTRQPAMDTVNPANAEPVNMEQTKEEPKAEEPKAEEPAMPETPAGVQEGSVEPVIYESDDHSTIICYDANTGTILWERHTNVEAETPVEENPEVVETTEDTPVVETEESPAEPENVDETIVDETGEINIEGLDPQELEKLGIDVPATQEAPAEAVIVVATQEEASEDAEELEIEETVESQDEQVSLEAGKSYVTKYDLEAYPGATYGNHVTLSTGSEIKVISVDGEFAMVEMPYRGTIVIAFINTVELLGSI